MTQFEAVQYVADQEPDSPGEWLLKVSSFESMPDGLVCLTFVEESDREREAGAFVWASVDELRDALDRIEAMMRAANAADTPPSSPRLSAVE